LYFDAYGKCT
jgi:hypothetical protein